MTTKTKRRFDEETGGSSLRSAIGERLKTADGATLKRVAEALGLTADDMDEATDTYTTGIKPGKKPAESFAEKKSRVLEERKVEAHYESFAEDFGRINTSKVEMLAAYRHARRAKPGLSAAEFLQAGRARP